MHFYNARVEKRLVKIIEVLLTLMGVVAIAELAEQAATTAVVVWQIPHLGRSRTTLAVEMLQILDFQHLCQLPRMPPLDQHLGLRG